MILGRILIGNHDTDNNFFYSHPDSLEPKLVHTVYSFKTTME